MVHAYPFACDAAEFKDKRVLVTGGTNGIGEAITRKFLLSGARVATTARSPLPEGQSPTLFVRADVATPEGVTAVTEEIFQAWGGLDILVNNVGGSDSPNGGFAALTDSHWIHALAVNLLASVRFDRAFLPGMIERRSGVIIHIGSIQDRLPLYDSTLPYAAAKAALANYSKGLANEVGRHGVRVDVVTPGFIETSSAHGMIVNLAQSQGISEEEARQMIVSMIGGIPLGNPGRPADVAEFVAFVASERAAYLHGSNLVLDGGTMPTS